jgi:hypothetical protein
VPSDGLVTRLDVGKRERGRQVADTLLSYGTVRDSRVLRAGDGESEHEAGGA